MNRIYSGRVGSAAAHSSPEGGSNAPNADAGSVSCCRLAAAGILCKQTKLKLTRSLPDRLRLLMFAARRQAVAECDAPKSNLGGGRTFLDSSGDECAAGAGVCSPTWHHSVGSDGTHGDGSQHGLRGGGGGGREKTISGNSGG